MMKTSIALFLLAAFTSGCSFHARAPEDYSKDTVKLLSSQESKVRACYNEQLKKDPKAGGTVVVDFTVEAKTGAVLDPKVNREKSKFSKGLGHCVVMVMDGLVLDPPDQRTGVATFTYEFVANEPKQL